MERRAARPKIPGFLFSGITVAVVVAIAALTLSQRQPPPPSIAEFAPQAVEQIKETQTNQDFAANPGGELPPPPPPPEAATAIEKALAIEIPRVRQCVGDPPRQIEDPQSPPCIPYWEGDNGGATSRGVTANEVRIAFPRGLGQGPGIARLLAFFNKRFQFYGRRLIQATPQGSPSANCAGRKAQAAAYAEQSEAFAALDSAGPSTSCFYTELARQKVIGSTWEPHYSEAEMKPRAPYLWSYQMGYDEMFANMGKWACARLVGGRAEYAGGEEMFKPRKFGVVLQHDERDLEIDLDPLVEEIKRCGGEVPVVRRYSEERTSGSQSGVTDPTLATNAMLHMKTENVTTIFCLCLIFIEQYLGAAADSQRYFPEWVFSSFFLNDDNLTFKAFFPAPDQRQHSVGLRFQPRQLSYDHEPPCWAFKEVDPSVQCSNTNEQHLPAAAFWLYRSLLLVASGIQMAGPHLTPETFESGLHRTRFPNPNHPNLAGEVGFLDGDHSMTNDVIELWWDEAGVSPHDPANGAWCYMKSEGRHSLNTWPKTRGPFFERPCDSGLVP